MAKKVQEPNDPEAFEKKLLEIIELEAVAVAERKTTKEREYWQGRKDGLRLALAILEPGESIWKQLTDSSPGFRVTEKEGLLDFMKDARYNIGAALYDYKADKGRIHIQTIMNLLSWISSYDIASKKGDLLNTDDALDPYDLYSRKSKSDGSR